MYLLVYTWAKHAAKILVKFRWMILLKMKGADWIYVILDARVFLNVLPSFEDDYRFKACHFEPI